MKKQKPDDLDQYIIDRKRRDPEFAKAFEDGFEEGLEAFKLGALLKLAREDSGMTQDQIAKKLHTQKSAISRIENHAEDMRLSTIHKYARALGKKVKLDIY